MRNNSARKQMLLNENVRTLIPRMAVPTIVAQMITTIYNLVDTYFVSTIGGAEGTRAIAAVSAALSIMSLLQAFGFFIGQGSANFISRALGRKDVAPLLARRAGRSRRHVNLILFQHVEEHFAPASHEADVENGSGSVFR